jgi:hypothetical protein
MKTWLRTLWNASLLRSEAFSGLLERRDVFFQGFLVIVVVALLVGFPAFVTKVVAAAQPRDAEARLEQANVEIEKALAQLQPFLSSMPAEGREQLAQLPQMIKPWVTAGAEISNLPTVLPSPLGALLEAFGSWLSLPFVNAGFPLAGVSLATWLGYGLWVMLLAKLFGGRGTLSGFLGTSALFAVPHVLGFFAWIPCVGTILNLIAFVWGVLIYVKATIVSQELALGKAVLAVLMPMVALVVLILLIIGVFGLFVTGMISNAVQ